MATTNPHNDSNLNRIDLSLHEFLGAPWKNSARSKPNQVALEMLLIPNNEMPSPRDPRGKAPIEEEPFVRRRGNRNKKQSITPDSARAQALQQRAYIKTLKLTYPSAWYVIRTSQATINASIQRVQHTVAEGICIVLDLIWLILTPARRVFDLFFGDEYIRAKRAFHSRVQRNRLWLGRSRGYTYLSAFYNRCRYVVSYFRVHQFYQIDLFLRNTFTIRRGIQTILPVGLFCSILHKAILAPTIVHSRGLEEIAKKMCIIPNESIKQLYFLENLSLLDMNSEFMRLDSGIIHTTTTYSIDKFVGGEYAEVDTIVLDDIIHPGEFLMSMLTNKPANVQMYRLPQRNIGRYELTPEEEMQIPDPPPPAPGEEEKDEETKLAEAAAIRATFIPKSRYRMLRQEDANMVGKYRALEKVRKYRNHREKRLAYKEKPSLRTYVDAMPYTQPECTEEEKLKAKRKRRRVHAKLKALPLYNTVASNVPWSKEMLGLIDFIRDYVSNGQWHPPLIHFFEKLEPRVVISPFGLTYEIFQSKPNTLRPFSKEESKILPYGFCETQEMLEGFYVSHPDICISDAVRSAFEWQETDILQKNIDENMPEDEDDEYITLEDEDDDDDDEYTALEDDDDDDDAEYTALEDDDEETDQLDEKNNSVNDKWKDTEVDVDAKTAYTDAEKFILRARADADRFMFDSTPDEPALFPFYRGIFFINSVNDEPLPYMVWKGIALQLIMYGGIECCIRLECRGVRLRLTPLPYVHRLIPHLRRMPEGVSAGAYVGETMNTVQIRKLLLAFQAKRGAELYGQSQWNKVWNLVVRPNMSGKQALWIGITIQKIGNTFLQMWIRPMEEVEPCLLLTHNVSQYMGLPKKSVININPRYFAFDKLTQTIQRYTGTKNSAGAPLSAPALAKRQQLFNRLGGEHTLARGLEYGKAVQEEICHFPLLALIKPGIYRMNHLPKGMILLGDPGNGRTYFVRTLATESRLPLLITESNRYLDEVMGLVRLKTLFKRARAQAPNILFIRDMDFMTRHRERYPVFTSVRATTQLLMAIDGYSHGTETLPSEQDIFIVGSMTTTIMMDEACMRSGRFEWVLKFYYPPINERHNMLILHSTKSIVNTTINVDWNYFTAMTDGFSCLDIRTLVNASAMYAVRNNSTLHTGESMAFALGAVNHIHDLPEVTFSATSTRSFFLRGEYTQRRANTTQYAPFFTQTGHVPMYTKLMHLFQAMVTSETENFTHRWGLSPEHTDVEVELEPDRTLVNGLLPLFCEGLFLYNTQKMCGTPYPIVAFDTYCSPLFDEIKQMIDDISLEHTLERIIKENLFITTFDLWRRAHPHDWTPTALFDSKSIAMRVSATSMWRSTRLAKKYSVIGGLTELEGEILWGPAPLTTKIKNRVVFLGETTVEPVSRDATLFGTFETNSDLAFKRRKASTGRRVKQVSMEIVDVMQKKWH